MFVTLAGAMSTAELGLSLAEMIRQGKVHAISCTGANLEEDVFNLVAHDSLRARPELPRPHAGGRTGVARAAPEPRDRHVHSGRGGDAARSSASLSRTGRRPTAAGERAVSARVPLSRAAPARSRDAVIRFDPKDSWMLAAAERNLPIFVPGWEDSTLGNIFAARCIDGRSQATSARYASGIEYMIALAEWYERDSGAGGRSGFFQIGGGIAGDFPICVVPMLQQDLQTRDVPLWALLLPDQRFDDELRLVLGRGAEREDHVGQAGGRHAQVHHRVGRDDRRAADLRARPRLVNRPAGGTPISLRAGP